MARYLTVEFEDPEEPLVRLSREHPGVTLDLAVGPGWHGPDGLRFTTAVLARGCDEEAARRIEAGIRELGRHVEVVASTPGDVVITAQVDSSRLKSHGAQALMQFESLSEERWVRLEEGVTFLHARLKPGVADDRLLAEVRAAFDKVGIQAQVDIVPGPPPSARSWMALQAALGTKPTDAGKP